jgi:hypothetical protein
MIKEKIYYWPAWLLAAQAGTKTKKIKPALVAKLGRSQIFLWRAFNIYDDFLDDAGQPAKLSLANAYFRRYCEIYYRLNLSENFYHLFNKIFTDLEKANKEEAVQPRLKIISGRIFYPHSWPSFKNLTDLSRKSLVLALSPLAINWLREARPDHKRNLATLNFFRFALAAKQLSDDARDWREDLENGVITAVNILILKKARRKHLVLNLKQRPEIVHLLFATEASVKITSQIKNLCQRANQEAEKAGWPANCSLIREIIKPLEAAVAESEKFRSLLAEKPLKML